MKNLFKTALVFAGLMTLVGCDPFQGILKVTKKFDMISTEKTSGCNGETGWDCEKKVTVAIPVGSFDGKIDFVTRDQLKITLQINGRKQTVNIPLSSGIQQPPDNGTFHWSANQIGQSFSVQGIMQTTQTDSQVYSGYERCSYTRNEYLCENDGHGGQVCHWVPVTHYGQQYVEYFNRNTHQNLSTDFVDQSTVLAQFSGARDFNEKIYLRKGQCF